MRRWIVVLTLTFAPVSFVHAAPGDPRLVQGILEWPAKLTVEPFVVLRSEDGRWYYAEVKGAKRLESVPMTAGARVTILGTEAARPHEITALAVSSGDAAALALALMSHATPTPPASAASPPPTAESAPPSKPVAAEPAPKTIAKAEPARPQPAASNPAPPARLPVTEPQKEKVKPSVSVSATPPGTSRWSEVRGTVHSLAGHEVVVRAEDGQLVPVDLSGLRGAAVSLTPGSPIVVYGMRSDEKFQAIGLIQQETRPQAKPVAAPPRR